MIRSLRALGDAWSACAVALALCGSAVADGPYHLTISGDGRELGETPIIAECRGGAAGLSGQYTLTSIDGKLSASANVFQDGDKTYLAAVLEKVPAEGSLLFKLSEKPSPGVPGTGVELITHDRRIEIRVDGKLVTEYIPDDGPKPYYFPVIGPSGAPMTRAFPMRKVEGEKLDHPHHRSLWFTHGSVNKVDFWSEVPGHGRIVETGRPIVAQVGDVGTIKTTDDWIGADGKKACEDERLVRVYATKKARIIDFDLTLKATAGPVTFGDTKEGMFGLRVASSMDVTAKKGGHILNAEGVEDTKAWGKPSPWVDYTGPVAGKTVGVAILNHPSSFRYPTTWHVRDYGLFAANPFGYHDFGQKSSGEYVLPNGESIRFRFRVILHDGDTASAALPDAFKAYTDPPKAVVE